MRTSVLGCGLALALLALVPAPAPALEWRGQLGLDYARDDVWAPGVPRLGSPQLQLSLGLDAGGGTPGILSWNGGVLYRRIREDSLGTSTARDALAYRLRATLFPSTQSPFTLNASALRFGDDASFEGRSGSDQVRASAYDADATVKKLGLPTLTLGYGYAETDRSSPVYGSVSTALHALRGGVSLSDEAFSYGARYRGSLSSGSYVSDNYDEHLVDLDVRTHLAPQVVLDITDSYQLRQPTVSSVLNVRTERNVLRAHATAQALEDDNQSGGYTYSQALQTAPSREDVHVKRHDGAYTIQRRIGETRWRVSAGATVSYSDQRVGDDRDEATGETLRLLGIWTRREGLRVVELRAGPTLGLLQPSEGGSRFGHGANAGAVLSNGSGRISYRLGYDVRYESSLFATAGWTLAQNLSGSGDMPAAGGRLQGQLTASAIRSESPLLGTGASRMLAARAQYARHRSQVRLDASISSGIVGPVDSVASDGLFLPAPFDTYSYSAGVSASHGLTRYLSAGGQVRYNSSLIPDRPDREETEARGHLDLRYGALTFSLEDRYVVSAIPGGGTRRANEVMLRAARVFGSGSPR